MGKIGMWPISGAVCGLASVLAACTPSTSTMATGGATTGPAPAESTQTVAPSSPADTAKHQAVVTYVGMWGSYAVAAATSDWQSPKIAAFATGTALSTMSRGLYADHYNGLVSRGHPINKPAISSAEPADVPTRIRIADCGDSTNWKKYRAADGQPVEGQPGGRRQINATVDKQADGSWRVSDFGVREVGSC